MLQITVTDRWHTTFSGGYVGVLLVSPADNKERATCLDTRKREFEVRLRERYRGFTRADFPELEILKAYRDYYGRYGQTYHVQGQLESVVQKGKTLPNVSPLVDANFSAELETLVLTAGHDADLLTAPLTVDATKGGEAFAQMNGKTRTLKSDDMMMSDGEGIVCTILYGQDERTLISPETCRALYVAYAPAGVPRVAVQRQLDLVLENVRLFAPQVEVELCELYTAEGASV